MPSNPSCTLCPLHKDVRSVCVWNEPQGKRCDILVVGEAPGAHEDAQNRPFVGPSGQFLRDTLKAMGLLDRCVITNVVKCRPPDNRVPHLSEIQTCSNAYLDQEVLALRPKYILLLGGTALKWLTGQKAPGPLGGYRGRKSWTYTPRAISPDAVDWRTPKSHVIQTYHPSACLREPKWAEMFFEDLARLKAPEFLEEEKIEVIVPRKAMRKASSLAIDLETQGLNPFSEARVLSVGVSSKTNQAAAYSATSLPEVLGTTSSSRLIGHNIKFDLLWLRRKYGYVHQGEVIDTMIAEHLLHEDSDSKSLAACTRRYTGLGDWKINPAEIQNLSEQDRLRYVGMDAAATWRVWKAQEPLIQADRLKGVLHVQGEVLKVLVEAENHGFYVRSDRLKKVRRSLVTKIRNTEKRLRAVASIDWDSPKQIAKVLFLDMKLRPPKTTPKGAPSVDVEALEELRKDPKVKPLVDDLLAYREAKKMLSTYVDNLSELQDEEGWIHPSYNMTGTVTGRLSCKNPNLQNIPNEGPIKELLGAGVGRTLIVADYSQIELRVGAHLSKDAVLLDAFQRGADLHSETAAKMFGSKFTDRQRRSAKTINFGIFYGVGPGQLSREAGVSFGEAQQMIRAWFELHPQVKAWIGMQERRLREEGFVQSPFGRRRRLPIALASSREEEARILRQSANMPIQSMAADITMASMVAMRKPVEEIGACVIGNVHDSVLISVPDGAIQECVRRVRLAMEDSDLLCEMYGLRSGLSVPTPVEIKVGPTWGELELTKEER